MRLLLAEDDLQVGESLKALLEQQGYAVDWVKTGRDALAALASEGFDGLVLDWRMPDGDGMETLDALRADGSHIPVVMLTARDAPGDLVAGLDAGADDYVVKPFEAETLLARLRAALRRGGGRAQTPIEIGPLTIDPCAMEARLRGRALDLAVRELRLLEALAERTGRYCSKASLAERLYSWDEAARSNTIEVYVSRLRRALGPDWITTLRGVGYKLEAPRAPSGEGRGA